MDESARRRLAAIGIEVYRLRAAQGGRGARASGVERIGSDAQVARPVASGMPVLLCVADPARAIENKPAIEGITRALAMAGIACSVTTADELSEVVARHAGHALGVLAFGKAALASARTIVAATGDRDGISVVGVDASGGRGNVRAKRALWTQVKALTRALRYTPEAPQRSSPVLNHPAG
ncbi:MAG: hypothetical protein WBV61_07210 [Rhodanobacteraceae bacterium]